MAVSADQLAELVAEVGAESVLLDPASTEATTADLVLVARQEVVR